MPKPEFGINSDGVNKLLKLMKQGQAGMTGPVNDMFDQWAERYLGFVRRRFVAYSKGGGNWKPLAPSTIARRRVGRRRKPREKIGGAPGKSRKRESRRRKVKSGKKPAILRDTSTLLRALSLGSPGNLKQRIANGIRVGFGGPSKHSEGGKATIADIARFHDGGLGNNPQRLILAVPDEPTRSGMKRDVERAVKKLLRMSAIPDGRR